MNRKFVGGLLISFFILFALVILSLFIPFGEIAFVIYTLFFLESFYFSWFLSRRIRWQRKINKKRTLIGVGLIILIISFYMSLTGPFFDSIFFTVLTYLFFISFCLFFLFALYKLYGRLNASQRKKLDSVKNFLSKIINQVFQIALIIFLLVLLIKEFYEIPFINLKYSLIVVIVLGVLSILLPYEEKKKKKKPNKYLIFGLGLIGAILIFFKTKEMGFLSYIIAVISFALIVLLGNLVYEEED